MHSVLLKSSSIDSKLVLKFSTTLWIHSLNVMLNKWSQPNQHLYSLVTIFKLHNRTVQHIFLLTSMSTSLIFTTTKPHSEQPHNTSYMKEREAEGVGGREGRGVLLYMFKDFIALFPSFQYHPKTFLLLCPSANHPKIEGEHAIYWFWKRHGIQTKACFKMPERK